jgi:ribose 5-phosphate isomerase B
MKIAISSDEYSPLIDLIVNEVQRRGHETLYFGPSQDGKSVDWPEVTFQAIEQIKMGKADEAIVLCWTGTGCTLVANKIAGIRAALCVDAATAKGARIWNHANVLGLSLRLTSPALLQEILAAWFETPYSTDEWNLVQMKRVAQIEAGR